MMLKEKMTKEKFIERSRQIHGDKYDYSKSEYVNNKTKVLIHCIEHNVDFMQTPEKHFQGRKGRTGCKQCSQMKMKQTNLKKYGVEFPLQSQNSKNKAKQTNLKKYGVENPAQAKSVQDKMKQTNLDKYGCEYAVASKTVRDKIDHVFQEKYNGNSPFVSKEIRNKAKNTIENKYGVENVLLLDDIKEKIKQSNLQNLGVEYPLQSRDVQKKIETTNMQKYGVNRPFESSEFQNKIKDIILDKYGVHNISQLSNIYDKVKQTNLEKYGSISPLGSSEIREKSLQTKRENNTFNTSKPEEKLYELFVKKFGIDNVLRQYKSDLYPFACDFYIKSIDTYIELNVFWTHGEHFFDKNNKDDLDKIEEWKANSVEHPFYSKAIYNWTIHDLKKLDAAIKNNLNYVVFWDNNLSDAIEWLDKQ